MLAPVVLLSSVPTERALCSQITKPADEPPGDRISASRKAASAPCGLSHGLSVLYFPLRQTTPLRAIRVPGQGTPPRGRRQGAGRGDQGERNRRGGNNGHAGRPTPGNPDRGGSWHRQVRPLPAVDPSEPSRNRGPQAAPPPPRGQPRRPPSIGTLPCGATVASPSSARGGRRDLARSRGPLPQGRASALDRAGWRPYWGNGKTRHRAARPHRRSVIGRAGARGLSPLAMPVQQAAARARHRRTRRAGGPGGAPRRGPGAARTTSGWRGGVRGTGWGSGAHPDRRAQVAGGRRNGRRASP